MAGAMERGRVVVASVIVGAISIAACGSDGDSAVVDLLEGTRSGASSEAADPADPAAPATEGAPDSGAAAQDADIVIDVGQPTIPIDRRLFGTNLPAWIGPGALADERFQGGIVNSGATLVRMPGGSWSNSYDWLACEQGDPERCYWTWAARPSDFVAFLRATGLPGSWTVNVNQTAQAAAAAVAFFNGDPGDQRTIGTDREGVDWGTVGRWAQLRVDGGNPDPAGIEVWEVGNELYGGKPAFGGEQCADFGWEDVWTCDGEEYVLGDEDHDGYLAIREAMIDVDADIEVGAVGVAPPTEWSAFGTEVIESAGDALDFYVVHRYGFDSSPAGDETLARPEELWPALIAGVRDELGSDIPIALTEYNLIAFQSGDTEQSMTRSQNALFLADTLGQLAASGVDIANQWNYANPVAENGTNYGLIDSADLAPYPAADAMRLWADVGSSLLPARTAGDLHVYPTLHDDGGLTIIVINLSDADTTRSLAIEGPDDSAAIVVQRARTDDLAATTMRRDGPTSLGTVERPVSVPFPRWSITRLDVEP